MCDRFGEHICDIGVSTLLPSAPFGAKLSAFEMPELSGMNRGSRGKCQFTKQAYYIYRAAISEAFKSLSCMNNEAIEDKYSNKKTTTTFSLYIGITTLMLMKRFDCFV